MESNEYLSPWAHLSYPKYLILDKEKILLRLLNQGDREFLLELFRDAPDEDVLVLREDFKSPHVVEQWFEQLDYQRVLPLAAVDVQHHRLAAVSLLRRGAQASRHNGEIHLFVSAPYRQLDLAALLLDEMLDLAARQDLLWLAAEVPGDHHQVVKAFRDRGFAVKATLEQYLSRPDGATGDVVLLRRPVRP